MGVRTTIGELDYEITQYSVSEDSTPTAITDSSGGVGEVSFTIKKPSDTKEFSHTPDSFINPGWALTDGDVELRRNVAINPSAAVLSPEWVSNGALRVVPVTDHPDGIPTAMSVEGGNSIKYRTPTGPGLEPSENYWASFWARVLPGGRESYFKQADRPVAGTPVPADGQWRRISFTFSTSPGSPSLPGEFLWENDSGPIGYENRGLQVTGVLVEKRYSTEPLKPYFDGSFPGLPDGGRYVWDEGAFESESLLVYDSLTGVTSANPDTFPNQRTYRVLRNGQNILHTRGRALVTYRPTAPARVSVLAVHAGQRLSVWPPGGGAGFTQTISTLPNQTLQARVPVGYDVGLWSAQGNPQLTSEWGAPRFEVEGTTVYRQHPVNEYTEGWLKRQPFRLADSRYGFTVGEVVSTSYQQETQDIAITARSRTADLNIFDIQAEPFIGTLGEAFLYYASLAGLNTDVSVDASIADTPIKVPGFHGELWPRLKELAAANQCEIALVAGVIYLRPLRQQEIVRGRDFSRNRTIGDTQLAQAVEVYLYDSYELDGDLFYPSGGWSPEVEVLNVNAGETAEYTLEFDASLTRFSEPTMVDFVSQEHSSSSVYTIVADDGLPVPPAQWRAAGGKVEFVLNPDTSSIAVTLTGPENIRIVGGETSRTFSLALASDRSGSRYSTLRIVGYGVGYHKTKHTFITGLPARITSTEVGVTIDNRFVNDYQTLNRVGVEAAKQFAGEAMSINGTVSTVTGRGTAQPRPSYQDVIDDLGSMTYAEAVAYYTTDLNLTSYQDVTDYWLSQMSDLFESQIFGRVQGARVWSKETRRWYRVRQASVTPENISFSNAEDDLNYQDMVDVRGTMSYADVVAVMQAGNLTYSQERMAGAYNGSN